MRQLQLNIEPIVDANLADFAGPSWYAVIDNVRQLHTGLIKYFYVYGDAGVGKTHLLRAICDSYLDIGKTAIQVPLLELLNAPSEAIESLYHYDLIALDDLEAIDGMLDWQKAVFNLINLSYEGQGQLIFSSRYAPSQLKLQIADLRSRLAQAVSLELPNGEKISDRQALIQGVLVRQGWQFDQRLVEYLLMNGPTKSIDIIKTLHRLQNLLQGKNMNTLALPQHKLKKLYVVIDQYSLK
ncbi:MULTISPECIES: DnaA ATPase domain-containing protein [unclassified Acinetobacter]|uniref:DnaA ATPase domain-containing protein n=1 Tax=unclassified Acinetobacter TaxID=196816 RepID=UPI0035B83E30